MGLKLRADTAAGSDTRNMCVPFTHVRVLSESAEPKRKKANAKRARRVLRESDPIIDYIKYTTEHYGVGGALDSQSHSIA